MILRNVSPQPQTLSDGAEVKSVAPQALVSVSQETGMRLLTGAPKIWAPEAALVPPPPPSSAA